MNNTLTVAGRDFLGTIRKRTFWISALISPIFILVVFFISFLGNQHDIPSGAEASQTQQTSELAKENKPGNEQTEEEKLPAVIVGGILMFFYLMLNSFSFGPILASFAEEKENRVMEIMISLVKPEDYILGKVLGQLGIALLRMIILVVTLGVGMLVTFTIYKGVSTADLAIFSKFPLDGWLIAGGVFYLLLGFLVSANIAAGIASAMPTLQESQGYASVMVLLNILPIMLLFQIISNPGGWLAMVLSYLPFTNVPILVMRNVMGAISPWENLLGGFLVLNYAGLSLFLAMKMFRVGFMAYNKKVSWREALQV